MKGRRLALGWSAALVAGLALSSASVLAQRIESTGTRLPASTTTGRLVMRFSEPREIARILQLLEAGKNDEALAMSEAYLESLDSMTLLGAARARLDRYFALNAYCASLTRVDRLDQAIAVCTDAIELVPSRWTALNNRGTAYLQMGRYQDAISDYSRALRNAPNDDVAFIIETNLGIAEDRARES